MEEIYADIPEDVRSRARFVWDMAIRQPSLYDMVKVLDNFTKACVDEYEREFVEFYFNARIMEADNASITREW